MARQLHGVVRVRQPTKFQSENTIAPAMTISVFCVSNRDAEINAMNGGNSWNTGDIINVPLDRTVEALAALRAWSLSDSKVGLYGVSRGVEHALLLTSLMAKSGMAGLPDAVAVHSPPDVVCGAFNAKSWRDAGDLGWQPWDPANRAWTWHGSSDDLLPTTPIEIERFEVPLFISHGTKDATWSVDMTRRLLDRLKRSDRNPEVHLYGGECRGFTSETENGHNELLIDFFTRHLGENRPGTLAAGLSSPQLADIVAKVENRATRKISRKLIFGLLRRVSLFNATTEVPG